MASGLGRESNFNISLRQFLTPIADQSLELAQFFPADPLIAQEGDEHFRSGARKVPGQQITDGEPVEITTADQWVKDERPALLSVIHLSFALHDPQPGLNRFVIWGWILASRKHNVLNGAFANSPQNFQQAKLPRGGEFYRLALRFVSHR